VFIILAAARRRQSPLKQAPLLNGIARWHTAKSGGRHARGFTHFRWNLLIYQPKRRSDANTRSMLWVARALGGEALPLIMRKAIAHGLGA